jgi:hypothetical protein
LGDRDAPGGLTTTIIPDGGQYADFEFAPADGTGMGTECACANVTDVHGNALTLTQAGSLYCTKNDPLHPASALGGDMVLCAPNKPRIMRGGTGSDSTLGILMEDSSTNFALRSEQFENAAWTNSGGLTVTANTQFAPNGAQTADNVANTTGGDTLCQVITTTSQSKHEWSVYAHAGSLLNAKLTLTGTGDSAGDKTCTFTGISQTGYTRLTCRSTTVYGAALTAVTACIVFGTSAPDVGDMDIWGAQYEDGAAGAGFNKYYVSSYIPTTTASVARAADAATFPAIAVTNVINAGSVAATFAPLFTSSSDIHAGALIANSTTNGRYLYFRNSASTELAVFDGTTELTVSGGGTINTFKRYWASWTGSTLTITNATDVATNTGSFDGTISTSGNWEIGAATFTTGAMSGTLKKVCLDHSPTRCR